MWTANQEVATAFGTTTCTALNLAAGGAKTYAVVSPTIAKTVLGKTFSNGGVYWTASGHSFSDSIANDNLEAEISTVPAGNTNWLWEIMLITSQTIYHEVNGASVDVRVTGFTLKR